MLTFLLALFVALGSFGLYMSAFFYPEIYRKGDLTLAGVGLFYALVLWICADRITGGVLLGQMASVTLIGWFGYQSLTSRLGYTPSTAELQTKFTEALNSEKTAKAVEQGKQLFSTVKDRAQSLLNRGEQTTTAEPYQPLTREDFGNPNPEVGKPDVMGTIGAVGGAVAGLFKKPEKNKEVYVRKEFREESTTPATPVESTPPTTPVESAIPATPTEVVTDEDDDFGFEEDTIAETPTVISPVEVAGVSDSAVTADEVIEEEVAYEATEHEKQEPES
ncbi:MULTISPECIES: Ycf66 family protein [Leptolyngbya]|uniref:Ycf66 family protein n=1 Tax=Leptolyngbya TaxID=47251 RepID=UPI001684D9C5|nr:Ycf66 family protein [Leptolyngbya sp. FACHB-1624]MBD1854476.1 hypothetical protein [Leptolyngbya sp. FACHB-1624]